jgi:hypothetical protein
MELHPRVSKVRLETSQPGMLHFCRMAAIDKYVDVDVDVDVDVFWLV